MKNILKHKVLKDLKHFSSFTSAIIKKRGDFEMEAISSTPNILGKSLSNLKLKLKFKLKTVNKTNFYKVELYSVKVRDRAGMGKGQGRDG